MSAEPSKPIKTDFPSSRVRVRMSKTPPRFVNLSHSNSESATSKMYSLAKLNLLKANPSNLNFEFSEIMSTLSTTKHFALPKSRLSTHSQISSKGEGNSSFTNFASPLKLRREKNLSADKRQILVERYLKSGANPSPLKKNLDLVWHQTLKEPKYEDYTDLSPARMPTATPSIEKSAFFGGNQPIFPTHRRNRSSERSNTRKITDIISFRPSTEIGVGSIQASLLKDYAERVNFKHIDRFYDAIRDFQKMMEHMQKTKVNILNEQAQLHDFVLSFVKEFDLIAKTPTKVVNKERLASFQTAIERKVVDVKAMQDLLIEQTRKIQKLCQRQSLVVSRGSMIPSLSNVPEEGVSISTASFTLREKKRQKLMEEVKLIQLERAEAKDVPEKNKKSVPETPGVQTPSGSNRSKTVSPSRRRTGTPKRSMEALDTKNNTGRQYTFTSVAGVGVGVESGPPSKRTPEVRSETEVKLMKDDKLKEVPFKSRIDLQSVVKEEPSIENEEASWDSSLGAEKKVHHKEMQLFFTSAIEELEENLKVILNDTKVFQARSLIYGNENADLGSNKILSAYIHNGIQSINESCERFLRIHGDKRRGFLSSLNTYFTNIEEIISSNLLKISSLSHLLTVLTDKLFEIIEFKNGVTAYEMGDKDIRKSYTLGFDQRKQKLEQTREAVLFMAQQIARTLPQIEHGADLHEDYLASLNSRVYQLVRGLRYVARLPDLDTEFEKDVLVANSLCKKLANATENLSAAFQADKFVSSEPFDALIECQKATSVMAKKLAATMKEIEHYSTFPAFTLTLEKPIRILNELQAEITVQETRSKTVLAQTKDAIIISYNNLVAETEAIEGKFNTFVGDVLINQKNYLLFDYSEELQRTVKSFSELIAESKEKIEIVQEQSFPSIIAFLPKPSEKLKGIKALEERVKAVYKLLNIGEILNTSVLETIFQDATTKNLTERLSKLRENIKNELREMELVAGSPIFSTEPNCQRATHKVLSILVKFKTILKKLWEYIGKVSQAYSQLRTTIESPFAQGEAELETHIESLQHLHQEFETLIQDFVPEHEIFRKFSEKVKEIHNNELKVVRNLYENFIQVNQNMQVFFSDIAPVTNLHTFFDILTEWPEMMHYCKSDFDKAQPIVGFFSQVKQNIYFRPELRRLTEDFELKQRRILTSLEVCLVFFELGKVFNAESLAKVLTPQIKEEKTQFVSFILDLEEATEKMHIKTELSKKHVGTDFEQFMVTCVEFLKQFHRYLLNLQERYYNLTKNLETTADQNKTNFVEALRICCQTIKTMCFEFNSQLADYASRFETKPKIIMILEKFLKDVIERDSNVYEKLFHEAKKMADLIKNVKKEFFSGDIQSLQYRKLSALEHETMQLNRDKTDEFIGHLDLYLKAPEISQRRSVSGLVGKLKTIFTEMRRVFEAFRIYYKYGKEIYIMLDNFLLKIRSNEEIETRLEAIDQKIEEMVRLIRNTEMSKKKESILNLTFEGFNEEQIENDIVSYFQDLQNWIENLRDRIHVMIQFEGELNKTYRSQIIWLRDDFPLFLRKWVIGEKGRYPKERGRPSITDYEGLWARIHIFEEALYRSRISVRDDFLRKAADGIEYMNQNFLNEWFFKGESLENADKIYSKLYRLTDKMKERRIPKPNMFRRMDKYIEVIERAMSIVYYLKDKDRLALCGFVEINEGETIESHFAILEYELWRILINLLLNEGEAIVNSTSTEGEFIQVVESKMGRKLLGRTFFMAKGFRNVILDSS